MDRFRHRILSVAVVCMLAASVFFVAFVYMQDTDDHTPPKVVATVCGHNVFGDALLDVSISSFLDLGYSKGDYVNISLDGGNVRGLITDHCRGLFMFEVFINIGGDGALDLGCFCSEFTADIGEKITIEYIGPSDRENLMPHYFRGEWAAPEEVIGEEQMNYRSVTYGDIAEGRLYRSSNALLVNSEKFSQIMNDIVKRHDADYLIDLNADRSTVLEYRETGQLDEEIAAWYIDDNRLFAESMQTNFLQDMNYAHPFKYMADNDGSYLLFCHYGKDRTGFVMILLEALMGASLEEIVEDYCHSYTCLYDTPKDSEEYRMYRYMVIPQLVGIHDLGLPDVHRNIDYYSYDVSEFDLRQDAENYLIYHLALTHGDVEKIRQHLSTPIE